MHLIFEIKNWLIKTFIVLVSFLCFTLSSISVSANLINYELGYRTYLPIDAKIAEETNSSTNQNLKYALPAVGFACKSRSDLVDYRNWGERFEATAAKGVDG